MFAGCSPTENEPEPTEDEDLRLARRRMEEFLDSKDFPIQFTCLYGDRIANSLGYRGLGFPDRAGYRIAALQAAQEPKAPEFLLDAG